MISGDEPTRTFRDEIKKVRKRFPPPPPPEQFTYNLLRAIFRVRMKLGEPLPISIKRLLKSKHKAMHHNVQNSDFRVMIELMCEWVDPRLKSRYANALQFALERKVKSKDLIEFLKSHGGIGACDEMYRASKRMKAR
jgi:hypothetical protein